MSSAGADRADSDSNDVGLMNPVGESRRTWPPEEPLGVLEWPREGT